MSVWTSQSIGPQKNKFILGYFYAMQLENIKLSLAVFSPYTLFTAFTPRMSLARLLR